MEMNYDKINGEIAFRESDHKYFNVKHLDRKYTSVTTLIGKFYEHFDEHFWSHYKALEQLMGEDFANLGVKKSLLAKKKFNPTYLDLFSIDVTAFEAARAEILAKWEANKNNACERGTEYHLVKENRFYKKPKHNLLEYEFNLPEDMANKEYVCEKNNFDLERERAILPEYLIYYSSPDGILNLAGQIDMLIKDGNDIYILDYKTNAKGINDKAHFDKQRKMTKRMFFPINNLDDTTLTHYTLQLSTYAFMLQKVNPEFNIKMLKLLHIDGNGVETEIEVEYKKEEVMKMLAYYKKQLKVTHFRETGKILE